MELLSLGIVSAAVTVLVQYIKIKTGTTAWKSVALSVAISLVGATGYYFASQTHFWETFLKILALANTFYALLIKQLE